MKPWNIAILLAVLVFLVVKTSDAQLSYTKPPVDAEQRRRMALKLLEPIKKQAQANPKSHFRSIWLENYAIIDPQWTADYVLKHPIDDSDLLYDNNTKVRLLTQSNQLRSDSVLKLLSSGRFRFFLFRNAGAVLANCKQGSNLYNDVLQLVHDEANQGLPQNTEAILSFQGLAVQLGDQQLFEIAESEASKFFESGNAQRQYERVLENDSFHSSYTNHLRGQFLLLAPEKYQNQFGLAKGARKTQHDVGLQFVLSQKLFSPAKKQQVIQSVDRYVFSRDAENYMNEAGCLGIVARYDLERALVWAKDAPGNGKSWAKLVIAPAVAKSDRKRALAMIKESYEEITQIDPASGFMQNYNYPAPTIACAGLPIVETIDPAYLPAAIDQTLRTIKPMSNSRMSTTKQHIFKTVAAIAKYDAATAKRLFEKYNDAVNLNSSPDFFRALIATDPENFWSEFDQIPEKDSRGTNWPLRIRLALLPALCQDDDVRFWKSLSSNNLLPIDASILSEAKK